MKVDNIGLSSVYQTQMTDQKNSIETDTFKKKLEEATKTKDETKIREAAEQFESFFVNMLFKEMRKTVQEGGLTEKSNARETFEGLLDEEMSKKITEAGGIGLADMMVKNFLRQYELTAASDPSSETVPTENNSAEKITLDVKG
ncbi:rod-binding protein [Fusibacter sp. 3D3]|uniref:rod-binding protein n=1 Tax=Fusibacter sp. 3D3 TaxID=1048380 RepID=UPI000852DAD7|nr:rod-binding protein [Fusibacter sp. 3D3]GAU75686.1 peptidoglycan hydrolase flagellar protein FlgJ [Fusibacter sp. 3D3]